MPALLALATTLSCGGDTDRNAPPVAETAPPPPPALDSAAATVTLIDSAARDTVAPDTAPGTVGAQPDTLAAPDPARAGPMIQPPRDASGGRGAPGDSAVGTPQNPAAPDTAVWTVEIVSAPPSVGYAPLPVLTALRSGSHPGYDRVTLELAQTEGLPSYHLEYVDRPLIECGSGRQIQPVGYAWLELRLEPAAAHTEAGQPTLGPREIVVGGPLVQRIYRTCDFEGVVTFVLALRAPNPFRVLTLRDPQRIVVDVQR